METSSKNDTTRNIFFLLLALVFEFLASFWYFSSLEKFISNSFDNYFPIFPLIFSVFAIVFLILSYKLLNKMIFVFLFIYFVLFFLANLTFTIFGNIFDGFDI